MKLWHTKNKLPSGTDLSLQTRRSQHLPAWSGQHGVGSDHYTWTPKNTWKLMNGFCVIHAWRFVLLKPLKFRWCDVWFVCVRCHWSSRLLQLSQEKKPTCRWRPGVSAIDKSVLIEEPGNILDADKVTVISTTAYILYFQSLLVS